MANFPARYAGGRWVEWFSLPLTANGLGTDNILAIPFLASGLQADSALRQHQTLAQVLAAGNAEANFSSYTRKALVAADISIVTNTSTGVTTVDLVNDPTWTPAGGAVNNTFGKFGFFYRMTPGAADSAIRCAYWHDHTGATNGAPYTAQVAAGGIGTANTG